MTHNPHFLPVASWKAAAAELSFRPRRPRQTAGHRLKALSIYVRDPKLRELPVGERSLEAHYGGFSFSQAYKGEEEARRQALSVRYGLEPKIVRVAGHEGRLYELGPEPEPGDVDPRSPAVVVWHDSGMFYLIASGEMPAQALLPIASSLY